MRKKYKLVVLSDNLKGNEALLCEHGLCAFLDTGKYKILLDTGASDQFIVNADRLGIDLKTVDYAFVSHGHRDHMGGLTSFLELNSNAMVLMSSETMKQKFYSIRSGTHRDISIAFDWDKYQDRFRYIDTYTTLNEEITVFPCNCRDFAMPKANRMLYSDSGGGLQPDDFSHELVFCVGTTNSVLYTGCAHKGLLNILQSFSQITGTKPGVVFGGFHLLDGQTDQLFETEEDVLQIGEFLQKNFPNTAFLTGHCTGSQAYKILKKQLNRHIDLFHTGFQAWI